MGCRDAYHVGPIWRISNDSLESQIGTGETFNYTFMMVGSHMVTVATKDGANTYYATVSFMITN